MLRTVLALLLTSPVAAADWPEFRGPQGAGLYDGKPLPAEWGPDKNVTWKTPIPGLGWSSPVAVGGKLYLTTAVPAGGDRWPDYSLRALCVDAGSGKLLWDKELFVESGKDAPPPHKKNSHASPTPVSDGKLVWVHFGHMGTACLDPAGNVVWKTQELKYNPVHGNGGSPILVDDSIVVACDGADDPFLAALDRATGKVRWKTPRKTPAKLTFSFATSHLIERDGKREIISPASDFCIAYDPADGRELWRIKYPQPGWSLICRPVYAHGLLFVCTGYTNQHLLAIKPPGPGRPEPAVVWQTKRNAANTPTPLVVGDELYMIADNGFMTCFDARTGKVHWSERLGGKAYSASPVAAGGKIYVTSEQGLGQVLAAGTEFKELSRSDLGERTFATFVPVDGALFVRTESQLYRFDAR